MGFFSTFLDRTVTFLSLGRDIRTLLIISVCRNLGGSLWIPLLGFYLTNNLGVSILMFGIMNTVQQLVSSLCILPSGFLSDNFGRKKMMIISMAFSITAIITLFFVYSLPWLFIISILQGLSNAFIGPSEIAYIIDIIPQEKSGRAIALIAIIQSLSNIIATSLAGLIAEFFGFNLVFIIALNLEAISLLITILYLKESLYDDLSKEKVTRNPFFTQLKNCLIMLKYPSLLAVLFGITFHQLGLGIHMPYLTIYANNVLMFSLSATSLMLGMQQLGIFIGHFPSGMIVDKYGGEISFAFHIFVTSPLIVFFTNSGNPIYASLILFSWGLTFGLDNVSRQKLIPEYKGASGIATAFGFVNLISGIISLISPTLGGLIWTNFLPNTVFYASAAINIIGSLPLFLLWMYKKRLYNK